MEGFLWHVTSRSRYGAIGEPVSTTQRWTAIGCCGVQDSGSKSRKSRRCTPRHRVEGSRMSRGPHLPWPQAKGPRLVRAGFERLQLLALVRNRPLRGRQTNSHPRTPPRFFCDLQPRLLSSGHLARQRTVNFLLAEAHTAETFSELASHTAFRRATPRPPTAS